MTDDEWDVLATFMEEGWRGEFDERKRKVYRSFLDRLDPQQVMGALTGLAETGSPFLPAVPEIVQAARALEEPSVPSWAEVWKHLMLPVRRGWPEARALDYLNELHPMMGHFMQTVGYDFLRLTEFDDPQYGGLRIKELSDRWDEFVGVAEARLAQGRALEAAGQRRGLGPARLDQAALLEQARGPRKELEAG